MTGNRQTPRERVRVALDHQQPDRTPFAWGFCATPEMKEHLSAYLAQEGIDWSRFRAETGDIIGTGPRYTGPCLPENTDIWGMTWKSMAYAGGSYREVDHTPLAEVESESEIRDYPWPDPEGYDYASLPERLDAANPDHYRAVRYAGGNIFEIYSWMTGLENAMVNLLVQPDIVRAALDRISAFFAEKLVRTLQAAGDRIDLVFLADDLGSQAGPLVSAEHYRSVIQPYHRRLVGAVREHAPTAKIMFHSDGSVFDLLPDLIDTGIDVLEAVQTECARMDPERLKTAFGDRLSFHGALSVQQLLPKASADAVESESRRIAAILGKGGGYIAAPSHAIQIGTPPENVLAMVRGILGADEYAAVLDRSRLPQNASA